MRVERLELKNFRGFAHLELELDPRFTVLVGGNGSGKTNVLEGLAAGLASCIEAPGRTLERRDVRTVREEHDGAPTLEPQLPMRVEVRASVEYVVTGRKTRVPIDWTRTVSEFDAWDETWSGQSPDPEAVGSGLHAHQELDGPEHLRSELGMEHQVFPLIAYYGSEQRSGGRGEGSDGERDREEFKIGSRRRGYESALRPWTSDALVRSWMEWRTQVVLQKLSDLISTGRSPQTIPTDPQLDAIEAVVCACIEGATRFFYDINHQELRLELEGGELIPFSQLSSGYRNLVAMVADIAWRAMQLNPHLGARAPQETEGIVLIDELELHLHPAWQRRVVDNLQVAFPRLQFVVTTHSPQVMASARRESVWLLHDGEAIRPGPVHGKDSNAILRDIMGVPERPAWMTERLDQLARLIEDGDAEAARGLLEEVREALGDDDPTVTGLVWELHDLEVHGAPDPQAKGA